MALKTLSLMIVSIIQIFTTTSTKSLTSIETCDADLLQAIIKTGMRLAWLLNKALK